MARHVLQRFLLTLPALWLVLTLVFLMIHIVPGDPVEQMLGEGAAPGEIVQLRHALGLDQPLLTQYGHYLRQIAHGDLGQSFKFQAPVRRIIFERYPATLSLAFLALIVCAAIAIPAGILAAYRRGQGADRAVGLFTLFGLAVPDVYKRQEHARKSVANAVACGRRSASSASSACCGTRGRVRIAQRRACGDRRAGTQNGESGAG